jgi:glyoxylase-like metal-dependent hydrolase (beta-lactamase superfamily II)
MRAPILLLSLFSLAQLVFSHSHTSSPQLAGFAPVPSSAAGPPISNVTGYRVQDLSHGAYMVTDGIYQSMFLVSTDSVIVVDAPPTIGHKLLYAIGNLTDLPVSHFIYSHAHADHIGAVSLILGKGPKKPKIIAHELTAQELAQAKNVGRPAPTVTFEDTHNITVGNQTLELAYRGSNHEPGNIFIYAPQQKVLMVVDIVFPGWAPFAYLGEAQNIPGYIDAHSQILQYDFNYYIGGHINRIGTRADVKLQRQYVQDLKTNCIEAVALSGAEPNATNSISAYTIEGEVFASDPGNYWALFNAYLTDLSEYCAKKTVPKYIDALGGTDVYTFSNAYAMLESLRIDYDILGPFGVA